MPREDDVRRIVQGGRTRGLSDDQIRSLVARYDERQAETVAPVASHETAAPAGGVLSQEDFDARMAHGKSQGSENLPMVGGMIGAAVGGIPGAAFGGMMGSRLRQIGRGQSGTLDAASELTEGAKQGGLQMIGGLARLGGKALYKGGVALLPKTIKQANPNMAKRGFDEGIALTRRGAEKAQGLVSGSRQQADDMIAAAEQAGAPAVRPMEVLRELRPVGSHIRNQAALGATDDMPGLVRRSRSFIDQNSSGIPVTRAQTLKRTAQDLADTAYKARDRGAVINSNELLTNEAQARGLRRSIESRVPDVGAVNTRTQELAGVQRGAEHAAETGHVLSRLGGVGAGAMLGSAGGALPAVAAAGAGAMLTTPGGLTSAGLGVNAAGKVTPQMLRAALLALMSSHEQPNE